MTVTSYKARGKLLWCVDLWVTRNGLKKRARQGKFLTKEDAHVWESLQLSGTEAAPKCVLTVSNLWTDYVSVGMRNRSWSSDLSRWKHLERHLGSTPVLGLNFLAVEEYRAKRLVEITARGRGPSPAQLDHEVTLLKRLLNYACRGQRIPGNPLSRVPMLRPDNVRDNRLEPSQFQALLDVAEPVLKPILLTAYDTGMRREEVMGLQWCHISLQDGLIRLPANYVKESKPRNVVLSERLLEAFKSIPRQVDSDRVFAVATMRKSFDRACKKAGLKGLWFHDLRRSFVIKARRAGVPESVVMRMTGHRTRSVFERYNVVDVSDLRRAMETIENGHALDTV